VHGVFVHPQHIGRGIGTLLMEHLEQTATRQGLTTLLVPASITAHEFYVKLGYQDVRQITAEAAGLDYIMMSKSLPPANQHQTGTT
jgi:GNAT superfamily N-acetyltransferase